MRKNGTACVLWLAITWMATTCLATFADEPAQPPIDPVRGRQLMERFSRGETLNAEEQAYLDRVRQAIRERAQGKRPAMQPAVRPAAPVNPADWNLLVPITDMTTTYKGQDGGLYGGGKTNRQPRIGPLI